MDSSSERLENDDGKLRTPNELSLSNKSNVFGMLRELSASALDVFIGTDNVKKRDLTQNTSETLHHFDSTEKGDLSSSLMTDEMKEREIGAVDFDVYISWAKAAGGVWVGILMILFYGGVEGINVLSKWWLAYWSEHGSDAGSQNYFPLVYVGINLGGVICMFFRISFVLLSGLRASRQVRTTYGSICYKL